MTEILRSAEEVHRREMQAIALFTTVGKNEHDQRVLGALDKHGAQAIMNSIVPVQDGPDSGCWLIPYSVIEDTHLDPEVWENAFASIEHNGELHYSLPIQAIELGVKTFLEELLGNPILGKATANLAERSSDQHHARNL